MDNQITDLIHELIKSQVRPLVDEVEEGRYPREVFRKFGEEKILGMPFPEEYGGMGLDWKYLVYFARKLSHTSGAVAEAILSHLCMGTNPIHRFGTEGQKRRFLAPALSGKAVGGMAIAEPDAGSDMRKIRMAAEAAEGGFRLSGNKVFISNANHFDFMIFAARFEQDLTLFIIERKGNEDNITTKPLQMMGMHGADIGEIFLDGAVCHTENVLGRQGEGIQLIMESLNFARLLGAACCFGIMEAAYDYGLQYAKEREQFGKSLVGFQSLKFMLTDMAARVDISRMLLE
ncbi:MAG: acyl-CoA dehydrogenase family protein, partial [Thermodesulfobacteriota bacterium]|nr:acyl-CoA dehydrogenase family protein [Thermodesulfobacteriota bacterium]